MKRDSIVFLAFLLFLLYGCSEPVPPIAWVKVGDNQDDDRFYVGQTLLLKGIVRDTTGLDVLWWHIRPVSGEGWTYVDTIDLRTFDKGDKFEWQQGVAIPDSIALEEYQISLSARQRDGKVVQSAKNMMLVVDSTFPVISELEVGLNSAGNDLHLATEIVAAKRIAHVVVEISGTAWQQEYTFAGKKLQGELTAHFHEHIKVAELPSGEYKVKVYVHDQNDRTAIAEGGFSK
ncbi:hypothetical protein G5B00_15695 [Parapedobacter sp. SGR-10]|uniref:hypothetical protein n=1 Tax=Parapedobacter sp. SGR-10 TaxID=2710879 RepID=UPI0013CFD8A4|nr:hypothetical protein [Parapedobacter sp. SGR-10]NGF57963.1 hypothetical protein [Parapedobacter sp. SGR-10]